MSEDSGLSNPAADDHRRQFYRDLFFEAQSNQAQYGRWILASLLAVHAGGLLAITQAGDAAQRLFNACGAYLLWGLALALICGGLAWINYTVAMLYYNCALNAALEGQRQKPTGSLLWISNVTLWGAPFGAIGSLACFVLAATAALGAL